MTFTFQGAGVKYVRLTVPTPTATPTARSRRSPSARRPAGRHDRARHDDRLGPDRRDRDRTPTFAFTARRTSRSHAAWTPGRGRAAPARGPRPPLGDGAHNVVRPRHRRRRQRRRDAGDRDVHGRHHARARTSRRPTPQSARAPTGATNDSTPTFDVRRDRGRLDLSRASVDSGARAACTSPWTTPHCPTARHSVAVRATDAAGNADASPATRSFTVDTQAPDTTFELGAAGALAGSSATLTFSADESGATFQCQLDGARGRTARRRRPTPAWPSGRTRRRPRDRRGGQRRRLARHRGLGLDGAPGGGRARPAPTGKRRHQFRKPRRRPSRSPPSRGLNLHLDAEHGRHRHRRPPLRRVECRLDGTRLDGLHVAADLHRPDGHASLVRGPRDRRGRQRRGLPGQGEMVDDGTAEQRISGPGTKR